MMSLTENPKQIKIQKRKVVAGRVRAIVVQRKAKKWIKKLFK